jgi:hypothetical protein
LTAARRPIAWGLLAGALLLDIWGCWRLAEYAGATNDLFPRWMGTRLWLFQGVSPYAVEVDRAVAQAMVHVPGGDARPFVFGFVYPGYVALLLIPLALLPFQVAATLWLLLGQLLTCAGALLCWRAYESERGLVPARMLLPVALAALFPASVLNLLFLQFVGPVFCSLAASWWLLTRRRDGWAGVVLALALIKPSLALAPTVALLWWSVRHGRRRLLAAWVATAGSILGVSLVALPGWPPAFVESTMRYAGAADARSVAGLLAVHAGATIRLAESHISILGIALACAGAIVLAWTVSTRAPGDVLAGGVLLGSWAIPPLYEWNSQLLLLVLIPVLRRSWKTDPAEAQSDRRGAQRAVTREFRPASGRGVWIAVLAVTAFALTAPAIARWPSESRLIWPVVTFLTYLSTRGLRWAGRNTVTERAGISPSVPTGV